MSHRWREKWLFLSLIKTVLTEIGPAVIAKFLVWQKKSRQIWFEFSSDKKSSQIYSTIELGLLCMIVQAAFEMKFAVKLPIYMRSTSSSYDASFQIYSKFIPQ